MNIIYQRHIFTWCEESILARSPGWGIAASSTPRDKQGLRELEKMASAGKPDYSGGVPAEMLLYSASCGYVKMRVTPRQSGNAGRRNKFVQMYQLTGKEEMPAAYLCPGEVWGDLEEGSLLSPLKMELPQWNRKEILESIHLYDRFGELVPLVYKTVAGEVPQLNLTAGSWEEADFAENARKTMFLIHEMIPPVFRRQAGYLSFSRIPVKGVSFVFSSKPLKKPYFIIDKEEEASLAGKDETGFSEENMESQDRLEEEFFSWITDKYLHEDEELLCFFTDADRLLKNLKDPAGTLKKLEYLWLGQYREISGPEDYEMILRIMPDILFCGEVEPELRRTVKRIRERIHAESFSEAERISYIKRLRAGSTMKSLGAVAEEILWALSAGFDWDRRRDALLQDIKERNRALYQKLMGEYEPESRESEDQDWSMDDGIPVIVPDAEDRQTGEPEFQMPRMSQMPLMSQMSQMATEEELGVVSQSVIEDLPYGNAAYAMPDAVDTGPEEVQDDSANFVLTGIVQGFMTGCMIYLAHYTIRLGHWKIALGLFGVWILLISNYWYILRQKGEWRPLWKIWGLCLVEGLLIDMTAWFFPDQRIRLYFFIILGIIVFLMQMAGIIQLISKQGKDNRKEGEYGTKQRFDTKQ